MLLSLGRGYSPLSNTPDFIRYDLLSALPAEFTYTRADTAATYRDANGKLQVSPSSAPRFDHDASGARLGLLIEGSVQNKLTVYNANPTATTNWTKGGDAASTFSVVDDPSSLLSAAGLDQVCTGGKVYKLDNSAGSTDAYVDSAATFDGTSAHTISAWISGGAAQLTRSGTSPTALDIAASATLQRQSLTLTPNASGDQMRILAKPGAIVYFILPQMEQMPFATSVIITTGAAATRQTDRLRHLTIATQLFFKNTAGYMLARYKSCGLQPSGASVDQYIASLNDNTTANAISPRIIRGDQDISLRVAVASSSVGPATNDVLRYAGQTCVTGLAWSAGEIHLLDGDLDKSIVPSSFPPTGISELDIGTRNGGNEALFGWVQYVELGCRFQSIASLGARMYQSSDIMVAGGGQSLMIGYHNSQESGSNGGRNKFMETLSALRPNAAIVFDNGATGGTYASLTSTTIGAADYWWDLSQNIPGPMLDDFYTYIAGSGISPNVILWAQGEADSLVIPASTTKQQYKDALLAIFGHMRGRFGSSVPVIIQRIGRRSSFSNTGGMQAVREAQDELIAAYDWIHNGPEVYDQTLYDSVHINDAGYVAAGQRMARKLHTVLGGSLSGVDGPSIATASRSGTTVTVTLIHDGGTDFTPSSGIEGFAYLDGSGSPVTISAAARTNATTITLTIASAVDGTLYYGYDAMLSLNTANVVRDNAGVPMPLRTSRHSISTNLLLENGDNILLESGDNLLGE